MADMISGCLWYILHMLLIVCISCMFTIRSPLLRADFVGILASLRKPEPTFAPCHFHKSIDELLKSLAVPWGWLLKTAGGSSSWFYSLDWRPARKPKMWLHDAACLQQNPARQRRFDPCEAVTICPALRLPHCVLCTNPHAQKLDWIHLPWQVSWTHAHSDLESPAEGQCPQELGWIQTYSLKTG